MALLQMGPLVERRVAGSAEEAVAVAAAAEAAEREVAFEVLESLNHCSACVAAAGELMWEWLLAAAVTFAAAAVACCMIVDLGVASFETRVAPEAPLTGSFGPCPHRACEAGLASASH